MNYLETEEAVFCGFLELTDQQDPGEEHDYNESPPMEPKEAAVNDADLTSALLTDITTERDAQPLENVTLTVQLLENNEAKLRRPEVKPTDQEPPEKDHLTLHFADKSREEHSRPEDNFQEQRWGAAEWASENASTTDLTGTKPCQTVFDKDQQPSEIYTCDVSSLFHFESLLCRHVSRDNLPETACATVDTGCQRLAVGKNTLMKMKQHIPQPLEIRLRKHELRFTSVHGTSTTEHIALVPTSLGKRGCLLKPALFEDTHGSRAPFLISLPLLLQGESTLSLNTDKGLCLHMRRGGPPITCHLGPSGALRIPIFQFTPEMIQVLSEIGSRSETSEFEIMKLSQNSSAQGRSVVKEHKCPLGEDAATGAIQASTGQRQRAEEYPVVGKDHSQVHPLRDSQHHPSAGDDDDRAQQGEGGHGAGGHDMGGDLTKDHPVDGGSSYIESYGNEYDVTTYGKTGTHWPEDDGNGRWPDRQHPGHRDPHGAATEVHVREDEQDLHLLQPREPEQGVLPVCGNDKPSVPVHPLAGVPADGGPGGVALLGGRERIAEGAGQGDHADDPKPVPPREDDQERVERIPGEDHVHHLPQNTQDRAQEEEQGTTGHRAVAGRPGGPGGLQELPGLAEGPGKRAQRQVRANLRKVVETWQTIRRVFEASGLPGDESAKHMNRLNTELMHEVLRSRTGTKRASEIAELFNVSVRNVKKVAEVFNPGCFTRATKQHHMQTGMAFDIQLGWDLLDWTNREYVRNYINTVKPDLVIISPPCEMFSQLQNILKQRRQQEPRMMARYLRKRRNAHKLLLFAIEIAHLCLDQQRTFVLEHPWAATSWTTREMEQLLRRQEVLISRTDQCMFGLVDAQGQPQRKRTGFATNSYYIWAALEQTCNNTTHEHSHIIGGKTSKAAQVYPEQLKNMIIKAFKKQCKREVDYRDSSTTLAQDRMVEHSIFLSASHALDEDREPQVADMAENGQVDAAGEHVHEALAAGEEEGEVEGAEAPEDNPEEQDDDIDTEEVGRKKLPKQNPLSLERLIQKAHEGLGHPNRERFLRILRYSNANKEVMDAARRFRCSTCERSSGPKPPRRAAPPRELQVNEVVGIDVVWLPKHDGGTHPALNMIDWASHFQLMIPIANRKPASIREAYRHWIRFFGAPARVALDLGREFRGCFADFAEGEGSILDPSSVESPYQRGITERAGKTFKLMLSKTMDGYGCSSDAEWRDLVDVVGMQKNRLLMCNGYSPIQRVIGYSPRLPGGLLSGDADNRIQPDRVRRGDVQAEQAMKMRQAAAVAFHSTECTEALRRAITSGPRPFHRYEIGEKVYFWRQGAGGNSNRTKPNYTSWHGPGRVVMTQHPSSIWVAHRGTLVKASPEHVRRATEDEQLTLSGWIDDLVKTRDEFEKEPHRGFLDLTDQPVPEDDHVSEEETDNASEPLRRVRYRLHGKRKPDETTFIDDQKMMPTINEDEADEQVRGGAALASGSTEPAEEQAHEGAIIAEAVDERGEGTHKREATGEVERRTRQQEEPHRAHRTLPGQGQPAHAGTTAQRGQDQHTWPI